MSVKKISTGIYLSILAAVICLLLANANKINLEGMESLTISLLPESESSSLVSDKQKALRYGFHKTQDCQEFEKAFLCIRKCLDMEFQIAHADKSCVCTCYKNSVLAQYKGPVDQAATKWKLGAPTTSRPAWAGGNAENKPNDYEVNENFTEFIKGSKEGESEQAHNEEATGEPEDHTEGSGEAATENTGAAEEADATAAEAEAEEPPPAE